MVMNLDEHGYVTIFDLHTREYRKAWPVDAKEQIAHGVASLNGPSIEMVKDGVGRKMVFDDQVDEHLKSGFKLVQEGTPIPSSAKPNLDGKTDFTKFDLATLRKFGAEAKIAELQKLTKPQLAEALDKAGFIVK